VALCAESAEYRLVTTSNHNSPDAFEHDDLVMDDLVRQTLDLESFEQDVHAQPAPLRLASPVTVVAPRRTLSLWLGAGLAAAAAVTFAVVMMQPTAKPVKPIAMQDTSAPSTDVAASVTEDAEPSEAVITTVASHVVRDDDLQQFADIDPDIATGLPSLGSQRSVVLAVYQGDADPACDCLAWSVEAPGDWEQTKAGVLEQVLRQPCMREASSLTLVKITGPRVLLPFHDNDARELARCVPQSNCDEACAFQAASECVPSDVHVQTRTIEWASR
jgi:hypothetical protein